MSICPAPAISIMPSSACGWQAETYWIDVTETAQGGDLETFDQADLGQALVIFPGVSALERIPREAPAQPLVTVTAVFDLRAGKSAEGSYTLSTVYRGSEADGMRHRLRRTYHRGYRE